MSLECPGNVPRVWQMQGFYGIGGRTMIIDEVIKYEEELVDTYENACKRACRGSRAENYRQNYRQFGERHRQLAEWLRELKAYREIWSKIKEQIREESDFAYADFDRYKEDILHAEPDELPDDDFRYGLQRAIEIINEHISEVRE